MPNILHFGSAAIKWCKKMAFTDPTTEHRITLRIGDFFEYRDGLMGRVDMLFVHDLDLTQKRRLFVKVRPVQEKEVLVVDAVLKTPVLEIASIPTGEYAFVGLPSVHAQKLYMLPVDIQGSQLRLGDTYSQDVLWIQWTLQYL